MGDVKKKKIIRDIKQRNIGNGYFLLKRKYNDNQKRINMSIATSFPKNYNLGNYYNTNNKSKQVYNNQKQFGNPAVIQPVPWEGNKEKFIKTANEAGADTLEWPIALAWFVPLYNGTQVTFENQSDFYFTTTGGDKRHWLQVMVSGFGGVYKISGGANGACDNFPQYISLPSTNSVWTSCQYFGGTTVPNGIQVGGYYRGPNGMPLINGDITVMANDKCVPYPETIIYTTIPT
jgi:hypothetical protein